MQAGFQAGHDMTLNKGPIARKLWLFRYSSIDGHRRPHPGAWLDLSGRFSHRVLSQLTIRHALPEDVQSLIHLPAMGSFDWPQGPASLHKSAVPWRFILTLWTLLGGVKLALSPGCRGCCVWGVSVSRAPETPGRAGEPAPGDLQGRGQAVDGSSAPGHQLQGMPHAASVSVCARLQCLVLCVLPAAWA